MTTTAGAARQPSPLYRLIESALGADTTLADLIAELRGSRSWQEIADEIERRTRININRETLRLWFGDRIEVDVKVAP
jgi:hypothetical protein